MIFEARTRTNEVGDRRSFSGFAEQYHDLGRGPIGKFERRLKGRTRIEAGADGVLKSLPSVEARGAFGSAVATEELGAVGGPRGLAAAEVEERNPAAELWVPRIANHERVVLGIQRSNDVRRTCPSRVPSAHWAYAVTESRRVRPDRFSMVNTDTFTGSSGVTNCTRLSWMPRYRCSKRLYPAP